MDRLAGQLVVVVLFFAACSPDNPTQQRHNNQPPSVWLAGGPLERSADSFSVHFEWGGADPDGAISHYEFVVVTTGEQMLDPTRVAGPWQSVFSTDTTLVFSDPPSDPSLGGSSRTFLIRAVDNEFVPSPEPEYISFTPRSLVPEVRILVPPFNGLTPSAVPPISTFTWHGNSPQKPDSVQFAMVSTTEHNGSFAQTIDYLRSFDSAPDWFPWVRYNKTGDKGNSWTTPSLDIGDYVFAIRAKNVVGAMNPVLQEPRNVRRIRVATPGPTGPYLTVESPLVGQIRVNACSSPASVVDVIDGLGLSFVVSASAEEYGGTVVGWRYGWDVLDPDDPSQWDTDYMFFTNFYATIPPRAFAFGVHTLLVEALDNIGQCSRAELKFNVVRATAERELLVVDDFPADEVPGQSGWDVTNGGMPSDSEHDAFWLDMVSNVEGFDPAIDVVSTTDGSTLPLSTIARYKSVVFSSYSDVSVTVPSFMPLLYQFIRYRAGLAPQQAPFTGCPGPNYGAGPGYVPTNFVMQAMQAGIHVLITGQQPIQNVVPRPAPYPVRWPLIPLYELEPGSSQMGTQPRYLECRPGEYQFAYADLCVDALDFAFLSNQRARLQGNGPPSQQRYCPVNNWRARDANSRRDDTMRGGIAFDPAFPPISLRAEAAGPGRFYAPASQGLDVEVYNPAYFREGAACGFVPAPRTCFEPIYALDLPGYGRAHVPAAGRVLDQCIRGCDVGPPGNRCGTKRGIRLFAGLFQPERDQAGHRVHSVRRVAAAAGAGAVVVAVETKTGADCSAPVLQKKWSGRLDSNQRPLAPHASALPDCATPRPDSKPNRGAGVGATVASHLGELVDDLVGQQIAQLLQLLLHRYQHVARLRVAERNLHLLQDGIRIPEVLLQLLARAVDRELLLVQQIPNDEDRLDVARTVAPVAGPVLLGAQRRETRSPSSATRAA